MQYPVAEVGFQMQFLVSCLTLELTHARFCPCSTHTLPALQLLTGPCALSYASHLVLVFVCLHVQHSLSPFEHGCSISQACKGNIGLHNEMLLAVLPVYQSPALCDNHLAVIIVHLLWLYKLPLDSHEHL